MDKETSEIAKLTERIAKDPKSKLFVPLAEEYKKAGDLEMSIHVLTEGLKNNPGYVTARSFLGRLLIEKGDLPGAQKEFEEVVKAIPDNLLAQRKLGDLNALQDRPAEALEHYKIALSLNPGDQETASLVSDVEAGRDVKARLPKPKPQESAKQPELASSSVKEQPKPAAPAAAPKPAAADLAEEAEEVLIVEPLEPVMTGGLEQELAFLAEPEPEPAAPVEGEETPAEKEDALFALNKPFAVEGGAAAEAAGAIPAAEEPLFGEEPKPEEVEEQAKQADDFTTDTLAELYISQGFFEKAVDIYERMLVDNPNSQGLKNKLANVRAMAAEAAPAQGTKIEAKPEPGPEALTAGEAPSASLDEYIPPAKEVEPLPDEAWSMPAEQPVPARAAAVPPSDEAWNQPATPALTARKEKEPAAPPKPPKMFDVGFEPVEYVPPGATLRKAAAEGTDKGGEEAAASSRKATAAERKETIDRLEKWLHTIKKEK